MRLTALALATALLWLAYQAGLAGIAGIYGDSAAHHLRQMQGNAALAAEYAAEGTRKIAVARNHAPSDADYALLAATFSAADGHFDDAISPLREGLADTPVRPDLWSALASYSYQAQGATTGTLHALDSALYFGPREYDTQLANATIILGAGSRLDEARRVRGWHDLVEAMAIPELSQRILAIAGDAGLERQLQTQLREQAAARAVLEQREQREQRSED